MEQINDFVIAGLGIATVFVALVCIIFICNIMGAIFARLADKPSVQIFQTGQYCINDISYYQIPQDVFYKSYMENCESLRRNGIQIEKIDSNMICGTIESDKNGMMTLSIPYDKNWHLYVDGEEKELYQVNIAMMGSFITAGTHKVELIYEKKNMWKTYVIIGIGVYAILALVGMSRKIKCSHEEH